MNLLIGSLATGAVYALVAIGIVLTYRATSIANFAQGEIMMVSAYGYAIAAEHTDSAIIQLAAALGVGACAGLACFFVAHKLLGRTSHLTIVMGTLAILVLLQSGARLLFTDVPIGAPAWLFGDVDIVVFGAFVSANSLTVLAMAVFVALAVLLWERFTTFGKAVLAAAEDPWRAALTGVNVEWTLAVSWALSGVVAGLAGLLLAPITGVFPTMGFDVLFPAFIAAIIGGFSSVIGALFGGFLLGVLSTYAVVYFGGAFKEVAVFICLISVLMWRPSGLFRIATGRKV